MTSAADATDAAGVGGNLRAQVLVQGPLRPLDYAIPKTLENHLCVGHAVRVPLGKKSTFGYVVSIDSGSVSENLALKEISGQDHDRPALPASLVSLLLFAAAYYGVHEGDMLACALPAVARAQTRLWLLTATGKKRYVDDDANPSSRALLRLAQRYPRGFTARAVQKALGLCRKKSMALLRRAVLARLLQEASRPPARARMQTLYTRCEQAADNAPTFTAQQRRAQSLWQHMPVEVPLTLEAIRTIDPRPASSLRALLARNLLRQHKEAVRQQPHSFSHTDKAQTPPPLTEQQQQALAALLQAVDCGQFAAHMLFGVTGSGKTEVYLRAIEHVVSLGKTALVLVPEIALTPQLGERFRARFGDRVATFHSGLSVAERRDEWLRVSSGEVSIGLGARSALFLPLRKLGIVVVDEEHEGSFKQDENPRYNARDLAVWRGKQADATVVLGSATPSLETWHNSLVGRYKTLAMPIRVHSRPMPHVQVLPLAQLTKIGRGPFSEPLAQAVADTLRRNEQVILFLNRRGFAPYIFCRDCGHSFRCDDCDVSLTLHKRMGTLVCHYCGFSVPAPDTCSSCAGHNIDAFGLGTEQLERHVRDLFGDVPLVRLDRDTVRKRQDLEGALGRFRRGEARIMIGTQMVAKGHDFPKVTLVGVMSADASLNFPDFRAAERTFQLLTQVAGRAGRGELPGQVCVQAFEPNHYAIECAQKHDFEAFAALELGHRKELGYPPFTHLCLIRYEGLDEGQVTQRAEQQAKMWLPKLQKVAATASLLGPAPAPLMRLRGAYRVHLLLKAGSRQQLRQALGVLPAFGQSRGIHRVVDIDPCNLL